MIEAALAVVLGATLAVPFQDGERVLFNGGDRALHRRIQDFYLTRYPQRRIRWLNEEEAGAKPTVTIDCGESTAEEILREQRVRREVSTLLVDFRSMRVRTRNAQAGEVRRVGDGYEFEVVEKSLPLPPGTVSAELNREALLVRGISADKWSLEIDGMKVWCGDAAELMKGVDLASLPATPMLEQSKKVLSGDSGDRVPPMMVKRKWRIAPAMEEK